MPRVRTEIPDGEYWLLRQIAAESGEPVES
jgi:hypothetical protein